MDRIKALRDKKVALLAEAEALSAKDLASKLTAEETARLDAILNVDLAAVNASIAREEKLMDERRTVEAPAAAAVVEAAAGGVRTVLPAQVKKEPGKFTNFGEQLQAVAAAGMNKGGGDRDNRLVWQAASGASEAVPSEGGFLVQLDFSTDLLTLMHSVGDLLPRVRRIPLSANSNGIKLPTIDETSRVNGSRWGGIQAYWANEAGTVTAAQPKFAELDLRLNKLLGIGYATDELLADASALEVVMRTGFTEELTFKTEDGIINGTGAGQMLGILNSGALVTVNPESGQATHTVRTENVLNMWARMPARLRRTAVWMINQDIEPQLYPLTLGSGTAVILLYRPPVDPAGYGTLLGSPVIPFEYMPSLGSTGDLTLMDPQSYLMIDKNGVQAQSSMHVRFVYDEMAFRFTYRVDGAPAWRKPLTPYKGSNTLSPYIVLGAR